MHDIHHRCALPFTEIYQHEMKVQDTTAYVLYAVDATVFGFLQTLIKIIHQSSSSVLGKKKKRTIKT